MFRIVIIGNWFYIKNDSDLTTVTKAALSNVKPIYYDELGVDPEIAFNGSFDPVNDKSKERTVYNFSELLDASGNAFADFATLTAYLDSTTGANPTSNPTPISEAGGNIPAFVSSENINADGYLTITDENGATYTNDLAANNLVFVTGCHDIALSNTAGTIGRAVVRDGDGGVMRIPLKISNDGGGIEGDDKGESFGNSYFNNPKKYKTGVYFDITTSVFDADIFIGGYLKQL